MRMATVEAMERAAEIIKLAVVQPSKCAAMTATGDTAINTNEGAHP
jgi:hypothetical protein